jgi:hypothetical protein
MKRKITRDNTVDEFLKERGAAAVTQKARDFFVEQFIAVAEILAEKALAAARADAPGLARIGDLTEPFSFPPSSHIQVPGYI